MNAENINYNRLVTSIRLLVSRFNDGVKDNWRVSDINRITNIRTKFYGSVFSNDMHYLFNNFHVEDIAKAISPIFKDDTYNQIDSAIFNLLILDKSRRYNDVKDFLIEWRLEENTENVTKKIAEILRIIQNVG